VIAHRGASAYAPENTLAAFELAVEQGADMLEFDVHLSADDQPVVIHDETLGRTTSGAGRVRDHSLRQLKRLDAGSWRDARFRGQRLQSLQEVLERFRARIGFAVELKAGSAVYPGIEDRVVSLLEIDHAARAAVARSNPGLARAALLEPRTRLPENITAVTPSGATAVGLPARLVTEQRVRAARAADLDLYIWTVNDPARMDSLLEWGVRGIITDRPDVLRSRPRFA